jgi:hypothetical protein
MEQYTELIRISKILMDYKKVHTLQAGELQAASQIIYKDDNMVTECAKNFSFYVNGTLNLKAEQSKEVKKCKKILKENFERISSLSPIYLWSIHNYLNNNNN